MVDTDKHSKISNLSPPLLFGHKFNVDQQKTVLELLTNNSGISSSALIKKMKNNNDPLSITERHLNRVRSIWGLSRAKGRPNITESNELQSTTKESSKKKMQ